MPLNRSHLKKLDLRVTIPGVQPWNSALNVVDNHNDYSNHNTNAGNGNNNNGKVRTSILSNGYQYDVTLSDREARAVTGRQGGDQEECFEELDLVSECSSPCSYTPGKYLQLCDIEPSDVMDDATLFPVSFQSALVDVEDAASSSTSSLLGKSRGRHPSLDGSGFRQTSSTKSSSRSRIFPFVSNKTLVIVGLCMLVAFTALGCLATVI